MYLDILDVFYTYLKRVQDTCRIHIRYIRIHVSYALPWCHSGYISGYIRIHVSWTLHHDTSRYTEIQNHDTCILDASWRHFKIQSGYIKDTFGIHAGSMRDTCICRGSRIHAGYIHDTCKINQGYMRDKCICSGSRIHEGYMRDTSKIHFGIRVSQMYPERYVSEMQDTCGIHARYMYICKGNQDTCGIHPRYMMRYMYLKFVPARIQARPQVGLEIRILECIPMYPTRILCVSCVSCIWGLRYIVS